MNKDDLKTYLLHTGFFIDNGFLDKYLNLLYENRLPKHIKRYSQGHHGIPRCVSRQLNEPVVSSKDNIFELEFSLHILAHLYLALCATEPTIKRANILAYKRMAKGLLSSEAPEELGKEHGDVLRQLSSLQREYENDLSLCGVNHPMYGKKRPDVSQRNRDFPHSGKTGPDNWMFGRRGELSPSFGRKHSEQSRQKMKDSWSYEKHHSPETQQKRKQNAARQVQNKTGIYSQASRAKALKTRIEKGNMALSEETKEKIREAHRNPIVCLTTGVYYESALDAERKTGLDCRLILKNCKNLIPYVQHHKKRKSRQEENYIYDDTKYIFCYEQQEDMTNA